MNCKTDYTEHGYEPPQTFFINNRECTHSAEKPENIKYAEIVEHADEGGTDNNKCRVDADRFKFRVFQIIVDKKTQTKAK